MAQASTDTVAPATHLFGHERGKIVLETHNHRYRVADYPDVTWMSASALKNVLFPGFASQAISRRICQSLVKKINEGKLCGSENPEYLNVVRHVAKENKLSRENDNEKKKKDVVESLMPATDLEFADLAYEVSHLSESEDEAVVDRAAFILREKWTTKGLAAAAAGTHLHSLIESYFKNSMTDPIEPTILPIEYQGFKFFVDDKFFNETYKILTTELSIYDKYYPICGTIDALLFRDSRDCGAEQRLGKTRVRLVLCDWKLLSKDLETERLETIKRKRYGKGPMSRKYDCKIEHYTLQQNIYRYILEQPRNGYNVEIVETWLVQFLRGTTDYKIVKVTHWTDKFLEDCIEYAMLEKKISPLPDKN